MLGPVVALLLLTSPAAAPDSQFCWSLDSEAQATCQRQNRLQQQLDDQQSRLDRMEQQERRRQSEYTAPGVSLPGNYTAPGVSTGSSSCSATSSLLGNC
jgi:hypothetical protein